MKGTSATKASRSLTSTAWGLNYLNSPECEQYLIDLVDRYFDSSEFFYEFIVGVTAALLSESDPNAEETSVFDNFIRSNMRTIRTTIDRIKAKRPELAMAEAEWERSGPRSGLSGPNERIVSHSTSESSA